MPGPLRPRLAPSPSLKTALAEGLTLVRQRTESLVVGLRDDDLKGPVRPFMGPILWDLGHVANFEERWLLCALDGRNSLYPGLSDTYDAFESPRSNRPALPVLGRTEAWSYLRTVRRGALRLLERWSSSASTLLRDGFVHRMVTQHERQHQETILQVLSLAGLPADPVDGGRVHLHAAPEGKDEERIVLPAGSFFMGTDDRSRAYDNERPRHRVHVDRFAMDRHPVTNRRWLEFVDDGGYSRRDLWTARGWAWRCENEIVAPLHWEREGNTWHVRRFDERVPLLSTLPVQHVSCHEAEAFARWSGGRLPTEAEWEKAAAWDPDTATSRTHPWGEDAKLTGRANVGQRANRPAPVGSHPNGRSALGFDGMLSDVYEWTSTTFEGYPGFRAFPYPEYSEAFFGAGYRVLRGASWALGDELVRNTYRNWDLPERRQIFAGVRLAWN